MLHSPTSHEVHAGFDVVLRATGRYGSLLWLPVALTTDVRTQADYQLLDPNFVGLIFSVFNKSENQVCWTHNTSCT